ncbi:Fungal specific transcription factor domain-containing protein [Rutstroemia sp. NJR-2017a BBW]|nr:Fungal specific transcription factor domain-containing protein [Rutstroemia sp. NJR-2017a BBW]
MENQPQKRRRVVKTCWECYRRKQKVCNRQQPCNICVSRNVPEKCTYSTSASYVTSTSDPNLRLLTYGNSFDDIKDIRKDGAAFTKRAREEEVALKSGPNPMDLFGQVGYATQNNSFIGLKKVLLHPLPCRSSLQMLMSSYLSLVLQLPCESIISELVDSFYLEANWCLNVIEEYYFRDHLKAWTEVRTTLSGQFDLGTVSRDLQYFPALLFQVLAISMQYLPPNTTAAKKLHLNALSDSDRLSHEYSKIGMELMSLLGRHNSTLTAVEHDLMRAAWLKNYSRGSESWHSLGSAISSGPQLTLTSFDTSGPGRKYRREITEILLASHMSVMLGRPRSINASDCTIRTPIDCDFPTDPSKTVPTMIRPDGEISSYSATLFQYELAHKVHELLAAGVHRPHIQDYFIVTKFHNEIMALINHLHPSIRPENPDSSWDDKFPGLIRQRYYLASAAYMFMLALHRPHASIHIPSRDAAITAAMNCLDAQEKLFRSLKSHQYRIYSLAFYSIDAGIFLAGIRLERPELDQALQLKIQTAISTAIARLKIMEEKSPMAKSGLQILTICFERIIASPKTKTVVHNEPLSSNHSMINPGVSDQQDKSTTENAALNPAIPGFDFFPEVPQAVPNPQLLISLGNMQMDSSFWNEMNQMIDLNVGGSMEETLWGPDFQTDITYNDSELF